LKILKIKMSVEKIDLLELDTKVYTFSIQVISFIKSLEKQGIYKSINSKTLQLAGRLSTNFPEIEDEKEELVREGLIDLEKNATTCFSYLEGIECNNSLQNEKANLLIDAKEIISKVQDILMIND